MALIVRDFFHESMSTSIIQSNEKGVEEDRCSQEGMACAASATAYPLKPDSMSLADLKSRSVTLGRRKQESNLRSRSPSEFTRVRRLNTFRCEVKRPSLHRKLVGKAFSVSGDPSSPPTNSFEEPGTPESTANILNHNSIDTLHEAQKEDKGGTGKEVVCVVIPSTRNERDDSAINEDEDEDDIQEVRLRLTRFPSDSNTSSSLSEDSSVSSSSPYLPSCDTCCFCNIELCNTDTIVYFASLVLHLRCFRCGQCGQSMGNLEQFLVSAENLPMCMDCTPKCHSCGKSILRNHINVLGNDFHEGCLACSHCKRVSDAAIIPPDFSFFVSLFFLHNVWFLVLFLLFSVFIMCHLPLFLSGYHVVLLITLALRFEFYIMLSSCHRCSIPSSRSLKRLLVSGLLAKCHVCFVSLAQHTWHAIVKSNSSIILCCETGVFASRRV